MKSPASFALFIMVVVFVGFGCSSPTEPDAGGGGNNIDPDFPDIPAPACANCNIPGVSDTITIIELLTGDGFTEFRPLDVRYEANWDLDLYQVCYNAGCKNVCTPVNAMMSYSAVWSDATTLTFDVPEWDQEVWINTSSFCLPFSTTLRAAISLPFSLNGRVDRFLLLSDGVAITNPGSNLNFPVGIHRFNSDVVANGITNPVYMRRDRYWVRQDVAEGGGTSRPSIELGGGSGTTLSISTTYFEGTSNTESEEFSKSLGFEGPGPLSFISGSINQTFASTTTVSNSQSVTKTFSVTGKDGKVIIVTVWTVTEVYTFTDVNGDLYTDPKWEFDLPALVLEATKERLQTYEF